MQPPAALDGVRVLIVDDNATNREILCIRLRSWGMLPAESSGGMAALEVMRQHWEAGQPFTLALVDMQMPGLDGETLARLIKADAHLADTRLVLVTSLGRHGTTQQMAESGFAAIITKPVRYLELYDVITTLLAHDPGESGAYFVERYASQEYALPQIVHEARILVAEDNIVNQQVALGILRKMGLRADAVASGEEVIAALENVPYDLVLMDVQMPVMDGMEATRCIRAAAAAPRTRIQNPHVPIIAMTAHAMQGDRERFLEVGMDDYIAKPVSPQALAQALLRWLPRPDADAVTAAASPAPGLVAPSSSALPVFDRAALLALLLGDEEALPAILQDFLDDTQHQFAELDAALAAEDSTGVTLRLHTIKGTAATIGGKALRAIAAELEQSAKAGDLALVAARYAELQACKEQLKLAILTELDATMQKR